MKFAKVLIVEDDVPSEILIRRTLTDQGFSITGRAANGVEAVSMALENPPDIILMDINIDGDLDGVETVEIIHQSTHIPVIYLTGHSDHETIERAKKTAPSAFLLKPFSKRDLAVTIEMALYKSELERKLKESEYRLSTILATISSGVLSIDLEGGVQYMNPGAEIFTGYTFERAQGKAIDDLIELCDCQSDKLIKIPHFFLSEDESVPTTNQPVRLTSAASENRIVNIAMTAIREPAGNIQGFVLVLRDMTEQYESENRIKLMAAALESIEDIVMITGARRVGEGPEIAYVNNGFENISGWCHEEVVGQSIQVLEGENTVPPLNRIVEECIKKGRKHQTEVIIRKRNGEDILTQWQISEVYDRFDKLSHLVFIIRDISGLRHLEDNLRQSQKLEAVGQLAGGIAHDFNNLLSVINSYSDLLSLKLDEEDPNLKYIQQIRTAGNKGADLVARLMTFSRRESADPKDIDLSVITQEIRGMLTRVIREDIRLMTHFDSDLRKVRADHGQIEQILLNLCVNARDAMPEGGEITISIKNKKVSIPHRAESRLIAPGNYVCLTVEDKGEGMTEEVKKNIFNPFFTTKEVGKGTGLGLSTVYGIINQCGGFIEVSSTLGIGTFFHLHFPAVEVETLSQIPEEKDESVSNGTERILVVEDDATFADCISGLLSLHGYDVHTARDGEEAINEFSDRIGDFNLLITDIVLPKVPGREVAARLTAKNPSLKLLFMTGYDDELGAELALSDESAIMQKPFSLITVLGKVRGILDETPLALQVC